MLTTDLARNKCPACLSDSKETDSIAVISPWVVELSGDSKATLTSYLTCSNCRSGWFEHGYSEIAFKAIYEDYRGDRYFRIRNSWEPTYTRALNEDLTSGPAWLESRKKQIIKALSEAGVKFSEIQKVLDFGGGHGGVIPDFPEKYLIDSNQHIPSNPDINLLRSLEEALEIKLDFVMCCGVLEHVNEPEALLKDILRLNCDLFLFEVPAGIPKHRNSLLGSRSLSFIAKRRPLWRLTQVLERKLSFNFRHRFPMRCSEHLQFFSEEGFKSLLSRCGFKIAFFGFMNPNQNLGDAKSLGFNTGITVVCRRATAS